MLWRHISLFYRRAVHRTPAQQADICASVGTIKGVFDTIDARCNHEDQRRII
jgi:hypothetical protein